MKRKINKLFVKLIVITITTLVTNLNTNSNKLETDLSSPQQVEVVDNKPEVVTQKPKIKSLGMYTITGYCPCTGCSANWGTNTATGVAATAERTVAVDPTVIPYGTTLIINGKRYVAEDCGGNIKGKRIDIYFDTHNEALNWGVQDIEVYKVLDKEEL